MPVVAHSGHLSHIVLIYVDSEARGGQQTAHSVLPQKRAGIIQIIQQIVSGGVARAGVGMAASVVMMIVPIAVFIFSQSRVVETMSTSGMKD